METAYSRVQRSGISGGTVVDLLTVALAQQQEQLPAMEMVVREILPTIGKAQRLGELSVAELQNFASADPYQATRMAALIEIGRRSAGAGKGDFATIDDADAVYNLLKHLESEKKEHFVVVMLDSQNAVLRTATVHIGTLTMSVVGPREVFREAIREGASSIVVAHNHPSGVQRQARRILRSQKSLPRLAPGSISQCMTTSSWVIGISGVCGSWG